MKKIWQYILAGIAAAVGGLFVSDLTGGIFNGMDYGSACVLGFCISYIQYTSVLLMTSLNSVGFFSLPHFLSCAECFYFPNLPC